MLLAMFEKLWPDMQYVTIVLETYQLRRHGRCSYTISQVEYGLSANVRRNPEGNLSVLLHTAEVRKHEGRRGGNTETMERISGTISAGIQKM